MSNDPVRPASPQPESHGEVELYWSRPPRPEDAGSPDDARGPHLDAEPGNLADLWLDLGAGD